MRTLKILKWATVVAALPVLLTYHAPGDPVQAFWPLVIGAVASIAGGLLSKKGGDKAAKAQESAAKEQQQYLRKMFNDQRLRNASQLLFGDMFAPGAGIGPGLNMPNPGFRGGRGAGNPGANYGDPMFNPVIGGPSLGAGSMGNTASMPNGPAGGAVAPPVAQTPGPTATPEPRAMGGPVNAGQPYMVGERGPEVITPQQPGMVIPNPSTAPGMTMPAWSAAASARPGGPQSGGGMMGPPQAAMQGGHVKQPMAYRAGGGPVMPGQPTMVGEQGPEVMQPTAGAPPAVEGGAAPTPTPLPNPTAPAAGQGTAPPGTPPGPPPPAAGKGGKGGRDKGKNQFQPPTTGDPTMGQLTSYWTNQMLTNPGQMSPIVYQRAQEQANMTLNNQQQSLQSGLAAGGININSPAGQAMQQALLMNHQGMRAEGARDYSLAQEGLYRQDISQGINQYMAMLNAVMGRQSQRGGLAAGAPTPYNQNAGAGQNMWGNVLGSLGTTIAGTNWGKGGTGTTANSGGGAGTAGGAGGYSTGRA